MLSTGKLDCYLLHVNFVSEAFSHKVALSIMNKPMEIKNFFALSAARNINTKPIYVDILREPTAWENVFIALHTLSKMVNLSAIFYPATGNRFNLYGHFNNNVIQVVICILSLSSSKGCVSLRKAHSFVSGEYFISPSSTQIEGMSPGWFKDSKISMASKCASRSSPSHGHTANQHNMFTSDSFVCPYCKVQTLTRNLYQKHLNDFHREEQALPFICAYCRKGFFSSMGLRHHMEAHKGRQFACSICDAKFQHKHHLKRHTEGVHKLKECRACLNSFPVGAEFNSHVLRCTSFKWLFFSCISFCLKNSKEFDSLNCIWFNVSLDLFSPKKKKKQLSDIAAFSICFSFQGREIRHTKCNLGLFQSQCTLQFQGLQVRNELHGHRLLLVQSAFCVTCQWRQVPLKTTCSTLMVKQCHMFAQLVGKDIIAIKALRTTNVFIRGNPSCVQSVTQNLLKMLQWRRIWEKFITLQDVQSVLVFSRLDLSSVNMSLLVLREIIWMLIINTCMCAGAYFLIICQACST